MYMRKGGVSCSFLYIDLIFVCTIVHIPYVIMYISYYYSKVIPYSGTQVIKPDSRNSKILKHIETNISSNIVDYYTQLTVLSYIPMNQ